MNLRSAALAVVAMVLSPMAVPAHAATADVVVVQGAGTYSPPLDLLPDAHSVSFNGTATIFGTGGIATTTFCSLSGTTIESVAGGDGVLSGACGGGWALPYCLYVRTGPAVTLTCVGALVSETVLAGTWTPNDTFPTTSYSLVVMGERVF